MLVLRSLESHPWVFLKHCSLKFRRIFYCNFRIVANDLNQDVILWLLLLYGCFFLYILFHCINLKYIHLYQVPLRMSRTAFPELSCITVQVLADASLFFGHYLWMLMVCLTSLCRKGSWISVICHTKV